jgi:hypothetical protein
MAFQASQYAMTAPIGKRFWPYIIIKAFVTSIENIATFGAWRFGVYNTVRLALLVAELCPYI